jgi:hypothetical protein
MRSNVEVSPLVEHFCSQQLRMPNCSACGKRHRDHMAMVECRQRRKRLKPSAVTPPPPPPTPPPLIQLQAEVTPPMKLCMLFIVHNFAGKCDTLRCGAAAAAAAATATAAITASIAAFVNVRK